MVDYDLEWVRDSDGLDRLVAEIYDAADADFRDAVSLEDYRHQFAQDPVVLARRNRRVIAWVQIGESREEDALLGRRVAFHAADQDTVCLSQLLLAAGVDSGAEGIYWAATTGDIQERIAADIGAKVHQELFRIWHAPKHHWRSVDELPPASTMEVRVPLSDALTSQYAEFYTAAGVKQCGETGCTTTWDAAMVGEEMAARDGSVYTEVLLDTDGLVAEAYAFPLGDEMCITVTHRAARSAAGLSTLVAALLKRVSVYCPAIRAAMVQLYAEDMPVLGPAFAAVGFEEKGTRALFRLRPASEPARLPA
ncbi:hypothetical protein [Ensifer sp.]|uniref:hypothetical protein n=1 Tax=Ensifer sp. TaxID=1872086 RepID=UPI002897C2E0|nr:hypothetical protein [Ensifer sp.]